MIEKYRKGDICPEIESANRMLRRNGIKEFPSYYLCQEGYCSECIIRKIAEGRKEYFPLR